MNKKRKIKENKSYIFCPKCKEKYTQEQFLLLQDGDKPCKCGSHTFEIMGDYTIEGVTAYWSRSPKDEKMNKKKLLTKLRKKLKIYPDPVWDRLILVVFYKDLLEILGQVKFNDFENWQYLITGNDPETHETFYRYLDILDFINE